MASRIPSLLSALFLCAGTASPAATQADASVSATVAAGIAYDSDVAVLDLDKTSGTSDLAALLELGLAWQWRRAGGPGIRAGYDLSQARQFDLREFDQRTQRFSLEASASRGETEFGLLLNRADATLGGERFLQFSQASPYVSRRFAERLVLRMAWAWTDKDFSTHTARDARGRTLSGDAFVLLDGIRHYLMLGYRHDDERAQSKAFEYTGNRWSAHWIRRVAAGRHEPLLRAGLRYEERHYAGAGLLLDAPRRDQRVRLETRIELPVSPRLTGVASYEFADHRSNLAAVDFSEQLLALTLRAQF
jgi:hypothetical protein